MAKRHEQPIRRTESRKILASVAWSAAVLALLAGGTSALAQTKPASSSKTAAPASTSSGVGTVTNSPSAGPTAGAQGSATGQPVANPATAGETAKGLVPSKGFPTPPASGTTIKHLGPGEEGAQPNADSKVKVDDNLVVDLHVNDEDLANVLQMLSIQSQRNIVASNNVSAKVKADLYGVTFYEALDAILHVNGYGYIDRGNFIYVYTLEELRQIEKTSRVRVSKVMKLNYLNAIDAAEFVKPLLSEGGQIKTNGKVKDFPTLGAVPVGSEEFANEATLVIYDFQEHVAEIEKLVKELDTRPAQVLVEATVLQTQLTESNAWGVDFSLIADLNFSDFGAPGSGPLRSVDSMIVNPSVPVAGLADGSGRAVSSTPGNTGGPATLKIGVIASDLALFVRMLDETGDTTILSNPKILALNRQPARVLVGRKVGYLNTTSTDTTTTQAVEFLDTGTQLDFRPFVTNEGLIRLELKPKVSEAVIRDAKDATGAAVTIPDEITNELVTNVMVRDGQTVVLGGLFRESTTANNRQVPFLGDIPILGAAFRGTDDTTNRSEIIFMITPTVINDTILLAQGEEGKKFTERSRTGAREGLLPWSRDKMTGQKLIAAQKLAADGDTERALFKIKQALSLNPNQPEAIMMRERLTNERKLWPDRCMLNHIVGAEAKGKPRSAAPAEVSNPYASLPSTPIAPAATAVTQVETEVPASVPETFPETLSPSQEPDGDAGMVAPAQDESQPEAQPDNEPAPEQDPGSATGMATDDQATPEAEPTDSDGAAPAMNDPAQADEINVPISRGSPTEVAPAASENESADSTAPPTEPQDQGEAPLADTTASDATEGGSSPQADGLTLGASDAPAGTSPEAMTEATVEAPETIAEFADSLAGKTFTAGEIGDASPVIDWVTVGFVGQGILAPEYWEPPVSAEVQAARERVAVLNWVFGSAWQTVRSTETLAPTSQTQFTEVPEATDSNADK